MAAGRLIHCASARPRRVTVCPLAVVSGAAGLACSVDGADAAGTVVAPSVGTTGALGRPSTR